MGSRPIPWQSRLNSLAYDSSHTALYSGWHHNCQCSSCCPVKVSRTGAATCPVVAWGCMSVSLTRVLARAAKELVEQEHVRIATGVSMCAERRCCEVPRLGGTVHHPASGWGCGCSTMQGGVPGSCSSCMVLPGEGNDASTPGSGTCTPGGGAGIPGGGSGSVSGGVCPALGCL